jgi:hypothetical protein
MQCRILFLTDLTRSKPVISFRPSLGLKCLKYGQNRLFLTSLAAKLA